MTGGGDPVQKERQQSAEVNYDGGIDLLEYQLEQGDERLSTRETIVLRQDFPLRVGMRWQTGLEMQVDYAISLRLYDENGSKVLHQDEVLADLESRATSKWSENDPVDTWFDLEIPAGLPPGVYELRLVVYNVETLTPTVKIDVWEPDVLLASMSLGESR